MNAEDEKIAKLKGTINDLEDKVSSLEADVEELESEIADLRHELSKMPKGVAVEHIEELCQWCEIQNTRPTIAAVKAAASGANFADVLVAMSAEVPA